MAFIILNGKIIKKEESGLKLPAMEYTFLLSQKIWFGFGGIPLFFENMKLLLQQLDSLNMPVPDEFNNIRELMRLTKRMLNKNKFYRSGYIYFQFFLKKNKINTLITSKSFTEFDFPFNEKGLLTCFSDQIKYSHNKFNNYSFYNKILWDVALGQLHGTDCKNTIILNEKEMVCECPYANIFMLNNKKIITPSLSSGCYEDILRQIVIDAAKKTGIDAIEQENIKKMDLMEMDEIFIVGEQTGMNWILGIDNKRFLHYNSAEIYKEINEYLKQKVN
jgi:branched-subunit amino acid aminotransferase/4-amino-4-deoxychorismate lyase